MKKQQSNRFNVHAIPRLCLALCTGLALTAASVHADDYKDKDKDKGAPGTASASQAGKAVQLGQEEQKFVKEAIRGGMVEVRMGQLAMERAQNPQVKQFGQRLVDDHKKASQDLRQIAKRKGMDLPEPSDRIAGIDTDADRTPVRGDTDNDADRTEVREKTSKEAAKAEGEHAGHKAQLKKLEGLSGTDFDREFVSMAVKEHQQDVSKFEKASEKCEDTELKAWIQKTLPTLRDHLQTGQRLQAQIGGTTGAAPDASEIERNP